MIYVVYTPYGSSFRGKVKLPNNLPVDQWPFAAYVDIELDHTDSVIRLFRYEVYSIKPFTVSHN